MKKVPRRQWVKLALVLAWASVFYNLAEFLVSLWFGLAAESLSLLGFGFDSLIETASAVVVLWCFSRRESKKTRTAGAEHLAHRIIGWFLLLLSVLLAAGVVLEWSDKFRPKTGLPGMIIAVISLGVMFVLYHYKKQAAQGLRSPALEADAFCTLSCMWLSGLLLAGSFLFTATGLAWFDSVTSLGIAVLIGREGWENASSKDCGCYE